MSGRTPTNDPLVELARLIGQDDPFRDSRPGGSRSAPPRQAAAQPYVEAPKSAPGWLARNGGAGAHDDVPRAPSTRYDDAHYDDAHYDHDGQRESQARQQDPRYDDPQHDDAAYHNDARAYQAAGYDAAYDPAHSDEAHHYYADEGHHDADNYAEGDEAPASRRRSGLVIVAAVVGLAALGTGGVFAYRAFSGPSGSSGQPPVIKAQDAPTKVVPPPQSADNQPGKQIYDRVSDKGGGEKLATPQEEPLNVNGGTNQRSGIPGLIAGVPPGGVAVQPPAAPAAQQGPANEPKKVKTVPIRPDQPTGTTFAPTRTPAAQAPPPARLGNNQPQTPPVRNGAVASGFVVQVASQRSEGDAQASYRALQIKYPAVLGNREAVVRKADLGEKGTFYRAQIGPFTTMEQANELCASLKSAGGQCVVQKN